MGPSPVVVIHRDATLLADAASSRFVTAVVDAQAARGSAHVVLTGGTIGVAVLASVATSRIRDAVDWSRITLWWGDERFLPTGHPDRNETQARAALLDLVPVDPDRVHAIPGPDAAEDVDDAARRYAATLEREAGPGEDLPPFDIVMLGIGPDAHVASLFPGQAALHEHERAVIGVRGAPKPPPLRVSLTLPALNSARDVWFLASGGEKAQAVGLTLSGAGHLQAPAAGVHGTRSTTWLLDRAAAAAAPKAFIRIGSP